jgi:hypothetical protein
MGKGGRLKAEIGKQNSESERECSRDEGRGLYR